jgi:hypothetical protein
MLKKRQVFLEHGRDAHVADDCLPRGDRRAMRGDRSSCDRALKHGSLLPARLGREWRLRDAALCGEGRLKRPVKWNRPESTQHSRGLTIGQVSCPATRREGARRGAPQGVLPRRSGDAKVWPGQALVAPPPVEDGPGVEAAGAPATVRRQPPLVSRVRAAGATRSVVDVYDPQPRRDVSLGLAEGPALATPAEMEKLGDTLVNHFDGIAAYCDHSVRFGVVESINTTIKGVLRRARGMRDETMLLLKLKWATARPIRSSRDLARFLQPQVLHSNR